MDLAPDFDEFIASLIAHSVEFVIVGAYALAFHGAPRFTGDLDVFVRPTLENATRLLAAVGAFGFPIADLRPQDVVDVKRVLQMGVEPVPILVMSAISGVSWEEAWRDRIAGPCGRHQVAFLGRETFLRNKRAAARPKDLADIDALTAVVRRCEDDQHVAIEPLWWTTNPKSPILNPSMISRCRFVTSSSSAPGPPDYRPPSRRSSAASTIR